MPHSTAENREPRKYMLISNPRTCSNLLTRILHLDQQPATKHGSYHFLECLFHLLNHHLFETSPDEWSEESKKALHEFYAKKLETFQQNLTPEPNDGIRIVFTKEHIETITEPTALVTYANGLENVQEPPLKWAIDDTQRNDTPIDESGSIRLPPNLTIFPDAYLEQWNPIFLIRHPARAFESFYRSMKDLVTLGMDSVADGTPAGHASNLKAHLTLSWTRSLYQWYAARGIEPVVIDADDVVGHTRDTMRQLARHVGFDVDVLQYTWKEASEAESAAKPPTMRRMLDSLDASAGVQADPAKAASSVGRVEDLLPTWTEKYGERDAAMLVEEVQAAVPDYEWLYERRMRP